MLATKPSTADSWYKYIDDSVNVNNKDGYADGVKTVDYDAILKNLAAAKTAADQVAIWQSFLRDIANGTGVYAGQKDAVIKQAKTKYGTAFAQWMKDANIPTAIQDIYTNEPLAKLPDYMQGYLAVNPNDATSVANYTTTLNNQLGSLADSKGNKLLTPAYINSVASGNSGFFDDLTNKVDTVAYDAATKQLGTSAPNLSSAERASFIKDFLYNPDKINAVLHPADTGTKIDNTGTKTDNTGTSTSSGLTSLTNPKLLDAQGNYRPYLSTWTAPKQGIATANSPYSGLLDAMLNKVTGANYGTPETNKTYDALTSALTQGIGINSLPKPQVTYNATNSAGITGLGINYTGRTLTPLNTQVTSGPSYNQNQIANAKTALEKAALEKAALEKAALEKAALEKAALEKAALEKAKAQLLSKYNFNNYITPETRSGIAAGTLSPKDPNLAEKIEYSKLLDSLAGNTGNTTTAASLQNASNVAENYNPIKGGDNGIVTNTTPYTTPSNLTAAQQYWAQNGTASDQAAIAQIIRQDQLNAIDRANNLAAQQASANAGNGIATNTGSFTSASNMNTNATGTNGASSIVSLLPGSPAPVNNTPNYVDLSGAFNNPAVTSLSMAPSNQIMLPNIDNSTPVNNTPNYVDLSGAFNNPAVLNITNAQQRPVDNTPNYATGLTVNTSPINASPVNNPAVLNLTNAPANDYGQYKDLNAAVAGGMTQEQINAADRDRNMRAMGLIP